MVLLAEFGWGCWEISVGISDGNRFLKLPKSIFGTAKGRGLFYIFILAAKIEKRAFLPMKIKFG
jgi:hypothetical protein